MLIGISGKIGSGKDTVANMIQELWPQYAWKEVRFAARVKEVVATLTHTPLEANYSHEGKQTIPPGFIYSLGELQQRVGTALRQHVHQDVWVNTALINRAQWTIVMDMRYMNEYQAILKLGGLLVRVEGDPLGIGSKDKRDATHESECELDHHSFHIRINNTGSLDDLRAQVRQLVGEFIDTK